MRIALNTSVWEFNIDNIDVCKIVDCLLENAIEAAAASEQKWVVFTLEPKNGDGMLLIANNSITVPIDPETPTFAGNPMKWRNHHEGFAEVWKAIEGYGNCIFHVAYYKDEMAAYLETRQNNESRRMAETIS